MNILAMFLNLNIGGAGAAGVILFSIVLLAIFAVIIFFDTKNFISDKKEVEELARQGKSFPGRDVSTLSKEEITSSPYPDHPSFFEFEEDPRGDWERSEELENKLDGKF
jgi:hypothetical protein